MLFGLNERDKKEEDEKKDKIYLIGQRNRQWERLWEVCKDDGDRGWKQARIRFEKTQRCKVRE